LGRKHFSWFQDHRQGQYNFRSRRRTRDFSIYTGHIRTWD
jgi:hypothetical protein